MEDSIEMPSQIDKKILKFKINAIMARLFLIVQGEA